jgi:hypothetical protein
MKYARTLALIASIAAIAAAWFWALGPFLGSHFYAVPNGATEADIIRQYWPRRLIEPEWIATPDRLMNWHLDETVARLTCIAVLWIVVNGICSWRQVSRLTFLVVRRCRIWLSKRMGGIKSPGG